MSGFKELVQGLSDTEKKELLAKLQTSLNLGFKDTDSIVSKESFNSTVAQRIGRELQKLGFLSRLMLNLKAFFANQTVQDAYLEKRLAPSKNILVHRMSDLIDFETKTLKEPFAQTVYDLYSEAAVFFSFMNRFFQQSGVLGAVIFELIEREYLKAAHQLIDLLPVEEIESALREKKEKKILDTQLQEKLEKYLKEVPAGVYEKVKLQLQPLYFLKPLTQYPYAFLLDLFGHNPTKEQNVKYPAFAPANLRRAIPFIERLYYGLYLVQKLSDDPEPLINLITLAWDKGLKENCEETLETYIQAASGLLANSRQLERSLPWREFLEYGFQDPYYSVKFYVPKYSVQAFYEQALNTEFSKELEHLLPTVRHRIFDDEKNLLFPPGSILALEFYLPGMTQAAVAYQLKGFQKTQALNLFYAFITVYGVRRVIPFIHSFVRMLPPNLKSLNDSLQEGSEKILDLRDKVIKLDKSLHPDAPEGKDLVRLKYELSSNVASQKAYLQLVQKKDTEAVQLIDSGIEAFVLLSNKMIEISQKKFPGLNGILGLPYLLDNHTETIAIVLDRLIKIIEKGLYVIQEASKQDY